MAKGGISDMWERSSDMGPYPREWESFEGGRPMSDGLIPRFWICDLPPHELQAATEFMMDNYMRDEQMAMATRALDDPQSVADLKALWRDAITRQQVSLAAYTDWPDGERRLAGLNILGVVRRSDPPITMPGNATAPMFVLMNKMLSAAEVFAHYGVSTYLVGLGLSVSPEFRGNGVGLRLLRAREPLCAALRVPLTVTFFSGAQSQKQSARVGFEVLQSLKYADFVTADGARPFAATTWPTIELKAKLYGSREDEKDTPE